jgi:hypothetical protein
VQVAPGGQGGGWVLGFGVVCAWAWPTVASSVMTRMIARSFMVSSMLQRLVWYSPRHPKTNHVPVSPPPLLEYADHPGENDDADHACQRRAP